MTKQQAFSACCCLKDCYYNEERIEKSVFRFLGNDECGNLYSDYISYRQKAAFLNDPVHCPLNVTTVSALYNYMAEAEYRIMYKEKRMELDEKMCREEKRLSYLDYKDERFLVTHPVQIDDIFKEAEGQKNCLKTKLNEIAEGQTDIGFFRRTDAPEESFVTFEVKDGRVVQLLGHLNKRLDTRSEEFKWFTGVYMKKKNFSLSGYD